MQIYHIFHVRLVHVLSKGTLKHRPWLVEKALTVVVFWMSSVVKCCCCFSLVLVFFFLFKRWLHIHFLTHILMFCICSKPGLLEPGFGAGQTSWLVIFVRGVLTKQSCDTEPSAAQLQGRGEQFFSWQRISPAHPNRAVRGEFKITARTCYPFGTSLWPGSVSPGGAEGIARGARAAPSLFAASHPWGTEGILCLAAGLSFVCWFVPPVLFQAGILNKNHLVQIPASQKKTKHF